jgi:fructokinase
MPEDNAVICLGEALVDFVSTQPGAELAQTQSFAPRFGGSQANVAVGAARFGARSVLLGAAGDDPWGRWLRERLIEEGVDVSGFALLAGVDTPHAFVAVGPDGEPEFSFFGDGETCVAAAAAHVDDAFEGRGGVFVFGSDSLVGEAGREATGRARGLALERGWPVLYDPNLRPRRWPGEAEMKARVLEQLPDCTVLKANLEEARALTGESDAAAAAAALRSLGARSVVVTTGGDGAVVAAEQEQPLRVPARRAPALDATGAGDAVAAVLAAALAADARPGQLAAVTELAMEVAARVIAVTGALPALPRSEEGSAALAAVLGN